MNILIERDHYEELYEDTIDSYTIGSELYGLTTKESNKEMLLIYHSFNQSFIHTTTLFQYKDTGLDVILCTPQQFVQNLLEGTSPIFVELLCSEEFLGSAFGKVFLPYVEDLVVTSNILTSFIGPSTIDQKAWNGTNDIEALREFVRKMDYLEAIRKNHRINFKDLKNGINEKVIEVKGEKILKKFLKDLRVELNDEYPRYPEAEVLENLDNDLMDYLGSEDVRNPLEKYGAFVRGFVKNEE